MILIVGSLALVFSFWLTPGAQAVSARPAAPDRAQVVSIMERMYVALTNDDEVLFRSVIAPEFYSFDGGRRFDGDALFQLIKSLHAAGKVYVWRVTEPEVQLFGDTALITYVNRGAIHDDTGKKEMAWLESALLQKRKGVWLIRFFHSTRVP